MSLSTKNEIVGRLHLWDIALRNCSQCLNLARRNDVASRSDEAKEVLRQYALYYKFKTGNEWSHLVAHPNDEILLRDFPRKLPLPSEFIEANMQLQSMAVIYFCQVFNKGFEAAGAVAKNSSMGHWRNRLEDLAFPDALEKEEFRKLKDLLEAFRDQQVAHADGSRFNVIHTGKNLISTTHSLSGPLREYLNDAVPKIVAALRYVRAEVDSLS